MNLLKKILKKILKQSKLPKLVKITPTGVPTWHRDSDRSECGMVETEPNQEVYSRMVRVQGEVIEPLPDDTPEDLASLISCAACDHEFSRVIVYPICQEMRKQVMDLIVGNKDNLYPMYEYRLANIIANDDLDSKTLIYKYGGKTHFAKPI